LIYLEERAQEQSDSCKLSSADGFQYVMMELVEFSDAGLIVLPLHRLVRGIAFSNLSELGDQLKNLFAVESVPFGTGKWDLPADSCLGILGLQPGSVAVLRRRQDIPLEALMPVNRSQAYREFGISILNHVILGRILGRAGGLDVAYTVDLKEAEQQTREGKYQLAFLLHGASPETVRAVADAKDRMPRKSTYFYPKLPTGLVINPLY
jgi:uncharacterized protein (DUF1015 family)